jgi:hypothetical protein
MKKSFAALLGATLVTGSAFAQDAGPERPMRDPMARADTNGDGVITRAEAIAESDARFDRMDVNHDGKITKDERPEPRGGRGGGFGGRMMERMDANGDGAISKDEQRAQALQRFDRLDANHDGKIDQAERDAARERMMQFMGRGGPDGPLPPPPADAPGTPDGN